MEETVVVNSEILLSISNHYQRHRVNNPQEPDRVIGALVGQRIGKTIKMSQTFDAHIQVSKIKGADKKNKDVFIVGQDGEILTEPGNIKQMTVYVDNFMSQVIQVQNEFNYYKDLVLVGWYSVSLNNTVKANDIVFHEALMNFQQSQAKDDVQNEFYYLNFNTKIQDFKVLPFTIYHTFQGKFKQIESNVEIEKTENISLEETLKQLGAGQQQSLFAENLQITSNALKMYNNNFIQLEELFPQISQNPKLMRELNEILNSLPQQTNDSYFNKLIQSFSETNIISSFAAINNTQKTFNDVLRSDGFKRKMGGQGGLDHGEDFMN